MQRAKVVLKLGMKICLKEEKIFAKTECKEKEERKLDNLWELSRPLLIINNRLRQDGAISYLLFNIVLEKVIIDAYIHTRGIVL
jgi:hypothetical protein